MIDLAFPKFKDPEDQSWHFIMSEEPVTVIMRSIATLTTQGLTPVGLWPTPGDKVSNGPLVITEQAIMADGAGVALLLSGGVPGQTYAVRVRFMTISGSILNRSGIVSITGL